MIPTLLLACTAGTLTVPDGSPPSLTAPDPDGHPADLLWRPRLAVPSPLVLPGDSSGSEGSGTGDTGEPTLTPTGDTGTPTDTAPPCEPGAWSAVWWGSTYAFGWGTTRATGWELVGSGPICDYGCAGDVGLRGDWTVSPYRIELAIEILPGSTGAGSCWVDGWTVDVTW